MKSIDQSPGFGVFVDDPEITVHGLGKPPQGRKLLEAQEEDVHGTVEAAHLLQAVQRIRALLVIGHIANMAQDGREQIGRTGLVLVQKAEVALELPAQSLAEVRCAEHLNGPNQVGADGTCYLMLIGH